MMFDDLVGRFVFPVVKDAAVVTTKSVEAEVKPVENAENPNGEFVLILSKDNLDRDADNLWADEWMHPLPRKIHMDTDHAFAKGLSVPYTAGSGVPSITENGDLLVKGTYAGTGHGQLTRQLVNEGHIWQASVSYQTHVMDDGRIVREVLNGTFTGVPANPEAVVLSSKAKGDRKKQYGSTSDDGRVDDLFQAVHDAAIAVRADCFPLQQATFANGKSRSASLKGTEVRNSNESNGYSIQITGPSGYERYTLRYKGRVIGRGDLRQAVAKSAGRERLQRFERQIGALACAEARVRNLHFDIDLIQEET